MVFATENDTVGLETGRCIHLMGSKLSFLITVKRVRGNKSKIDGVNSIEEQEPDLDTSKLASETAESEVGLLT